MKFATASADNLFASPLAQSHHRTRLACEWWGAYEADATEHACACASLSAYARTVAEMAGHKTMEPFTKKIRRRLRLPVAVDRLRVRRRLILRELCRVLGIVCVRVPDTYLRGGEAVRHLSISWHEVNTERVCPGNS
jgi:hypothetical protein